MTNISCTTETEYSLIDRRQWTEFISNHATGNVFNTPEMVEIYEKTKNYEPVAVIAFDEVTNKIVGVLVGVIQKEHSGLLGKLSARAIIWGAPIVLDNDPGIAKTLITSLLSAIKNKAIYCQFRNLWNVEKFDQAFKDCGFNYEDHLDIHFDLTPGKEVLWNNVHPTRRKQVNRGYKRGLSIQVLDKLSDPELSSCYNLLELVYRKARLPMPKIDHFKVAFDILAGKGYLKAIITRFEDNIVGFRFFFCFNGLIYDWFAASDYREHDKYPNDVLAWELINWGIKNNFRRFDFGGAGKPNQPYGVRDYKMKFGGELVNLGRYEKIINKPLFLIGKTGLMFWKLLQKKNDNI